MDRGEWILRIFLTLLFFLAGLLCLNQSVSSFGLAADPPDALPNAWYQSALIWGTQGILLLVVGVFCQFKFKQLSASWLAKFIIIILLFGLSYPYAREQILIDYCLDSGGAWSEKRFECQR